MTNKILNPNPKGLSYLSLIICHILLAVLTSCGTQSAGEVITSTATAPSAATNPVMPTASPTSSTSAPSTPAPSQTIAPTAPPPTADANVNSHVVQPGDTLLGLAKQYDVPMAGIQLQNEMGESTVVQAGQTLSIPPGASWGEASPFWVIHVVKEGETLIGIARAYDLEPDRLKAVNDLTNADQIIVSQNLVLPLDGPAIALAPTPVPPPTETPLPPPTAAPSASPLPVASPTELPTSPPSPAAPPADIAAWPRETVRLINEVRARHGLEPLTYNETLAQAAQAHANDCVQRGWCGHTGSDGADIKTRILRAGYDPSGWAECWAHNQTPQDAVDVWMDEIPPNDPHRRTLLTTWLSEIGVGVAETDWGYYFIADFGRP